MGTAVPITSRQFICKVGCFQMIASISWITGMGGMGVIAHSFVRSMLLPKPLLQRTSIGVLRGEKWGQGMWMLWAEQLEAMSPAPCVAPLDTHRGGWQGNPDSLWGGQHLGNSRLASRTWCQHPPCAPQWMALGWSGCPGASTWVLGASQCTRDTRPSARGTWCKCRVSTWWQLSSKLKSYSLPVKSFTGLCWCRPCKIILRHLI